MEKDTIIIGCIGGSLVLGGFVWLRFIFNSETNMNMWDRLTPPARALFFGFQQIAYWGLLIMGLTLCFLSATWLGLITLGSSLYLYNTSFSFMSSIFKDIPVLRNSLSLLIGKACLVGGLIVSFATSVKHGLVAIGVFAYGLLLVKCLVHLERERTRKRRATQQSAG